MERGSDEESRGREEEEGEREVVRRRRMERNEGERQ
jgi:hypothetical protein